MGRLRGSKYRNDAERVDPAVVVRGRVQTDDFQRVIYLPITPVVAAGVGVGLVAALALSRFVDGMLYGISATDPWTYGVLTTLMFVVAGAALYLPARRASRVDPAVSLRAE